MAPREVGMLPSSSRNNGEMRTPASRGASRQTSRRCRTASGGLASCSSKPRGAFSPSGRARASTISWSRAVPSLRRPSRSSETGRCTWPASRRRGTAGSSPTRSSGGRSSRRPRTSRTSAGGPPWRSRTRHSSTGAAQLRGARARWAPRRTRRRSVASSTTPRARSRPSASQGTARTRRSGAGWPRSGTTASGESRARSAR
mmetsp:Transcript_132240/g.411036  ORF Transcript_132240/g.411036 Transcript_132240/m.411036 type:complete len:201 (-) Transcript_132240:474-1076(-)